MNDTSHIDITHHRASYNNHHHECLEGGMYKTQCELGDRLYALSVLEDIDKNIRYLISHLLDKYGVKHPRYGRYIKNMQRDYKSSSIRETHPLEQGETSYVINNGDIMSLCIRYYAGGDSIAYHDINTLMFVSLHELSHIAAEDTTHEPIFWDVFKWILKEAVMIGLYRPVDYGRQPHEYCGKMYITFQPLYAPYLNDI